VIFSVFYMQESSASETQNLDVGVKDARAIGREFVTARKRVAKGRVVRVSAGGVLCFAHTEISAKPSRRAA
jgi:hypothetical protein